MNGQIVFISRSRVKDGKLDQLKEFLRRGTPELETDKPRTIAFLPYLNEEGTELAIVHVFHDAAAFDAHLEGAGERSEAAYEFIDTAAIEIYGPATEGTLEMMRGITTTGARFEHHPDVVGGFLRPAAG